MVKVHGFCHKTFVHGTLVLMDKVHGGVLCRGVL
jgi:hypothetical protein